MAQSMLGLLSSPPNSSTTGALSISPIVKSTFRFGAFSRFRNKLPATVGVSSHASTSMRRSTAGRSFNISTLRTVTRVTPRKRGKKISKTETSNVGAANCRKREKEGICLSWARRACVAASWEMPTPFGVPVDPDVYMRYARSSG